MKRFENEEPTPHHGFVDLMKWVTNRDRGRWEDRHADPGPPPPERVDGDRMRATLVNHATVLVQMDGMNILTDPTWSERTSPVSFAGPRRRRPPGLRFDDLPPIDLVVISHDHYDHLDVPTLRRLVDAHSPVIVVGLRVGEVLSRNRLGRGVELGWWDRTEVGPLAITSVPARHFSGRSPTDRDRRLWMGAVIEGPSGSVFFAGDTGYGRHFAAVRERLGAPRLALLPIGAYRPTWFMRPIHMTPADAVRAHRDLGAGTSVAIHYGTFPLADDGQDEPVADLRDALEGRDDRFLALDHGIGEEIAARDAGDLAAQ